MAARITGGASGSDLARLWQRVRRRAVLDGEPVSDVLLAELLNLEPRPGKARDQLWLAASEVLGLSNRQIASSAGVSHPTVAAAIKRARSQP
jgi:DNA-directed RNA polymerase specialized sigma24 family protein